jgi:hypothetical protein
MDNDYSKEIFDKYYDSGKILKITLMDSNILEGLLVGFYHGEKEKEPYITRWRFIHENQATAYKKAVAANENNNEAEIINQEDIRNVEFKYKD